MESSTLKGKRCFKSQGIGHIAFDCPNRNIVTIVEDESEKKKKLVMMIKIMRKLWNLFN